jgi:phosphate transport system protein
MKTRHFWEQRLAEIREHVLRMAGLVERNLGQALRALFERDDDLCDLVEAEDAEIDQLEIQIDEMIVAFSATHAPTARDCRLMLVASKISGNLERMADEATKIARRARELNAEPPLVEPGDLARSGQITQEMVRESIRSFAEGDCALALKVIARDQSVDDIHKQVERALFCRMVECPTTVVRALNLMTVSQAIERIADHATNIAEEAYYLNRGRDIRHGPSRKAAPEA